MVGQKYQRIKVIEKIYRKAYVFVLFGSKKYQKLLGGSIGVTHGNGLSFGDRALESPLEPWFGLSCRKPLHPFGVKQGLPDTVNI